MLERRVLPTAAPAFALGARQLASASASASSSRPPDRHVVQSQLHTMKPAELLRFDNTSGITITAIIAVVAVLAGVFLLCIAIASLLSKTNAPRHEAFPYAYAHGQPPMYQPSASLHRPASERKDDPDANLLDSAAPLAGNTASLGSHSRSGSSGVAFPGPAAARRGPLARPRLDQPHNDPSPAAGQLGAVNYNGREMTINMAGPGADEAARAAAEARLDRERARRSTVVGGPPPLASTTRASRYARASMLMMPPDSSAHRLSTAGSSRRSRRMSRARVSRLSTYSSTEADAGGNLSARRRSVTSTGPGVAHVPSNRWGGDEDGYTGRRSTGGRSVHGGASRASRTTPMAPPLPRSAGAGAGADTGLGERLGLPAYTTTGRASLISADSMSVYDAPGGTYGYGAYAGAQPEWAAAPASQASLLDPLQAHGPNPFVLAMH